MNYVRALLASTRFSPSRQPGSGSAQPFAFNHLLPPPSPWQKRAHPNDLHRKRLTMEEGVQLCFELDLICIFRAAELWHRTCQWTDSPWRITNEP